MTVSKIHILGSGYHNELLGEVPKESLPKQFGGTCECAEGLQLNDAGPWQEKEWAKPAKCEGEAVDANVGEAKAAAKAAQR